MVLFLIKDYVLDLYILKSIFKVKEIYDYPDMEDKNIFTM